MLHLSTAKFMQFAVAVWVSKRRWKLHCNVTVEYRCRENSRSDKHKGVFDDIHLLSCSSSCVIKKLGHGVPGDVVWPLHREQRSPI